VAQLHRLGQRLDRGLPVAGEIFGNAQG
jgi:hypothetical protein